MLIDVSVWIARLSKDGRFMGTATAFAPTRASAQSQVERRFPTYRVEGLRPQKDHDVTTETREFRREEPKRGLPTLLSDAFDRAMEKKRKVVDKIS